jgi:hypothetical protein
VAIKVSHNNKGTWITWEAEDQSLSATFRIKPEMTDEETIQTLARAVNFIATQMGVMGTALVTMPSSATQTPSFTKASGIASPAGAVSPPDPNAPRVPMMPPASLSDQPAGGAPVDAFGWSSLPTHSVPGNLAGDWEMIPEGEM